MIWGLLLAAGLASTQVAAPPPTDSFAILHAFETPPVRAPYASLLRASDGAFYGTLTGGNVGPGAIVRYSTKASRALTVTVVHAFNGADGSAPYAALIEGPGGTLYGTTSGGGVHGNGTIFQYQVSTATLTTLYSFGSDPSVPYGALLLASDGALYGAAGRGSAAGSLFRFDLATGTLTILHQFDAQSGGWPTAAVIEAQDGALYGTTGSMGGPGSIYRYDLATAAFTVVHAFSLASGQTPWAALIQGVDGNLYGTATAGGAHGRGVIFRFDPSASAYTVLHHFDSTEGATPYATLHQGADGALYGTTAYGGDAGGGTLFRYDLATSALTTLEHFDGEHGLRPYGGLIDAGDGTLLGMASEGGWGLGTIYRYDPVTASVNTVHRFVGQDGANPHAAVTDGGDGSLYGTTADGGKGGNGTLFRYRLVDGAYSIVHDFLPLGGRRPLAGLIRGADGDLYGTTFAGGLDGTGTLFGYDVPAATFTSLVSFNTSTSGIAAGLVQASDGALYGATACDFCGTLATLFRFDLSTGALTTAYTFFGSTGEAASALTEGADRKLYGTSRDQIGHGAIFRFDTSANPGLVRLDPSLQDSYAGLLQTADGSWFGTTARGGATGDGTIFRHDGSASPRVVAHSFSRPIGAVPTAALIQGADGALYGTTLRGGTYDAGTVFRFDPVTLAYTLLHSFRKADGAVPESALFQGPDGALYGTTVSGGPRGGGVLFRVRTGPANSATSR
jgi:uncharacterized repeat protein (TIGR03803 family)